MSKRHFFVIFAIMLLLTGCFHTRESQSTKLAPPPSKKPAEQKLPKFTRLVVQGPFDVNLSTASSHQGLKLQGDPRDIVDVKVEVRNGTLYVTRGDYPPLHASITLKLRTRYLYAFEYHGKGNINASNLRTPLLDLVIENPRLTRLQGQIGLRHVKVIGNGPLEVIGVRSPDLRLNVSGEPIIRLSGVANLSYLNLPEGGRFSLYWVKSRSLRILARQKAFVQLAGTVNRLDVELWNNARFNGRYLRARRAFVKTHGHAIAEMSAVAHQHTLANNASDIYFYNVPTMKADFMGREGAVLDMRDLGAPDIQEYNQYNK